MKIHLIGFSFLVFVQCSALYAEIVGIKTVDLLGFPTVVLDNGDEYSGIDAEAFLFEEMQTSGRIEKLKERASAKDISSAEILCAMADRVMIPSDAAQVRAKMLEDYLGMTKASIESDGIFDFSSEAAEKWSPVLRLYLFRFSRFEGVIAFPLLFDKQKRPAFCKGTPAELILCGNSQAMNVVVRTIRAFGDPECSLFLDFVAGSNVGITGIDFFTDATKTALWKKNLGADNLVVRLYDGIKLSETDHASAYREMSVLAKEEHCSPAYSKSIQLFRSSKFNAERTTEMLRDYACFAYLQTKSYPNPVFMMNRYGVMLLWEYYLGVKDFENASTIAAFLAGTKNNLTGASQIEKWILESEPKMAAYLNRQVFAATRKSPKQCFPDAWALGERMAEAGYYENAEFEKRFQDSLRERAKELKAKRAAASASAHGNDDK